MCTPAPEFPDQACSSNSFFAIVPQDSLRQLIDQFSLSGCCLFRFCLKQQQPDLMTYASNSLDDDLPDLASTINWQRILTEQPLVVSRLENDSLPENFQFYGCIYHSTPEFLNYLLCWHHTSLSQHQQYGISLYAQVLSQQLLPPLSNLGSSPLTETLQRTRHQLRTPLSLMLMYVDLLEVKLIDSASQEWLNNLRTIIGEMYVSLNHLTEGTSSIHQHFENYDLRQLLEECCQEMQPWIHKKQLSLVYDVQPLWVRANRWKMKQVLQNLLSNAIAFSPIAEQITCEWQIFQTEVLIKISDRGPGLSSEDLRSFGTPYYSRRPGGTGLGLAIAKQIILEHQGSFWAENLPDGGAQLCIMLPRNL